MRTKPIPGSVVSTRKKQKYGKRDYFYLKMRLKYFVALPKKIQTEKLSSLTCAELPNIKSQFQSQIQSTCVRRFVHRLVEMLHDAAELELTCVTCFKNGRRTFFFLNEVWNEIVL